MATGALRPPEELVRFTLDPEGRLTADLGSKLPGRGAYASATRDAVSEALSKGLFAHTLKRPAPLPEGQTQQGFVAEIEVRLARRLSQSLGLARRAGALVTGFEKTAELLRGGDAALAIIASDAGDDGRKKISRMAHDAPALCVFDSAALSASIGAEGATYAAVRKGESADRILRDARRLEGFKRVFLIAESAEKTGELQSQSRE